MNDQIQKIEKEYYAVRDKFYHYIPLTLKGPVVQVIVGEKFEFEPIQKVFTDVTYIFEGITHQLSYTAEQAYQELADKYCNALVDCNNASTFEEQLKAIHIITLCQSILQYNIVYEYITVLEETNSNYIESLLTDVLKLTHQMQNLNTSISPQQLSESDIQALEDEEMMQAIYDLMSLKNLQKQGDIEVEYYKKVIQPLFV